MLAGADGAPALDRADVVQPALWAVMVSLAAAWHAAGVTPDAVVGHSQGEIAAACVAGILSLEDAARVVALRSRALMTLAGRGGMVSVAEPAARVRDRLTRWGDRLAVAAVNGPEATVVSGEPAALEELAAACEAETVRTRPVPVDYASHSAQVEQIQPEILAALAGISPGPARVPMVSAMTGQWLEGPEAGTGYWYDSLRASVEFDRAVRVLAAAGHQVFIEVSPHPVLTTAVTATLESRADIAERAVPVATGTLRRDDGGAGRLLSALAEAHVRGVAVDWAAVLGSGRRVDLPTYGFQRQRYWPHPSAAVAPVGGDGASSVAEARFWAAVEGGDVQAVSQTLAIDGRRPLAEVLPALASWRRRERDRSVTAGWRYQVTWVPVPDPGPAVLSGTWLVVAVNGQTAGGLVTGCARALADSGAEVVVLQIAADASRETLTAGVAGISGISGISGVSGMLSLLALEEAPAAGFPVVPVGLALTLALVQALADAGVAAPLWLLTCGAVTTGAGEQLASPVQAMAWGLGRVVALEHPDLWGGLVDLPPVLDERAAARLCGVLAGCAEDQVAVRASGLKARRLARAPLPRDDREAWAPQGTALITGGTGAIGGHVARWLAQRGAPRVLLTSRSGPAAPGVAGLAGQLAALGSQVSVVTCDIAERAWVTSLLEWIRVSGSALSAVIHTAGVLDDGVLNGLTTKRLATVLAAKAAGAAVLDELTRDMDLDAFVLFSSAAAIFGSAGQGNYSAANAYLDALAQSRHGRGQPAISVAWGQWAAAAWPSPPKRSAGGCAAARCPRWTRTWRSRRWARPCRAEKARWP